MPCFSLVSLFFIHLWKATEVIREEPEENPEIEDYF
jgi:hypothetical protein